MTNAGSCYPSLSQLIDFLRDFTRDRRTPITAQTYLEEDLGITGDDGAELLEEVAQRFDVVLHTDEDGYQTTFGLGDNEYLFHSEGFDPLCIGRLIGWLRNKPRPVIRDLSVGELHRALVAAQRIQN
ncbi:hypothetical protein [Serratia rubidaea]|uniref:hypothetical protein n=1 Tax=Serratia rubidaea TaxID=61652 RepID=UPI00242D52D7|nr:hypothetical protein [Serratia rubidaea]MCR0996673.1 DUF1493 family protein [Serratia rubidaea]